MSDLSFDEVIERMFHALWSNSGARSIKHLAIMAKITPQKAYPAIAHLRKNALEYRWTLGHSPREIRNGNKFFVITFDKNGNQMPMDEGMLESTIEGHLQTLKMHSTQNLNQAHALNAARTVYENRPMIKSLFKRLVQGAQRQYDDTQELQELIVEVAKKVG